MSRIECGIGYPAAGAAGIAGSPMTTMRVWRSYSATISRPTAGTLNTTARLRRMGQRERPRVGLGDGVALRAEHPPLRTRIEKMRCVSGEPLIYERLKRHTTARLLMGPWTHVGGSLGAGLPQDGVPDLDHIALRWFDHYLKGIDTGIAAIPKVTQYAYGDERYEVQADWPDPRLRPTRRFLRAGRALRPTPDGFP